MKLLVVDSPKKLDAAHHRWQRSILGISLKDRITNAEVRTRTGQQTMDNILRERRYGRKRNSSMPIWLFKRCNGI